MELGAIPEICVKGGKVGVSYLPYWCHIIDRFIHIMFAATPVQRMISVKSSLIRLTTLRIGEQAAQSKQLLLGYTQRLKRRSWVHSIMWALQMLQTLTVGM